MELRRKASHTGAAMASQLPLLFFLFSAFLLPSSMAVTSFGPESDVHYEAAKSACEGTPHQELCVSTLASFDGLASMSTPKMIERVIKEITKDVDASCSNSTAIAKLRSLSKVDKAALADCVALFHTTLDQLNLTLKDLLNPSAISHGKLSEIETFLSAAMTNQYTCLDGFSHSKSHTRSLIQAGLYRIIGLVSSSLALAKKVKVAKEDKHQPFPEYGRMKDGFPEWLSSDDRHLLTATVDGIKVDLVVAQDGSGNYRTIKEAVEAAPSRSSTRFVIYIKAGGYFENVEISSSKTNLMFIGDGMWKTVVKASLSVGGGSTTFNSATVAVNGAGFIARDITFQNAAGPEMHQAVAFRSSSDLSAFYRCSFAAYQDTLYVHTLRQFYRECDVYGTVDFIFGNAAVVLQNCNLYARKPMTGQENMFTAQGRTDPNQNTGITIQNCKIAAGEDLLPVLSSFKSYLGRPWKEYSRTVVMQSQIDNLIAPPGWHEWDGNFALSTLVYREYQNRGPGSNTSKRVTWPGYKVITQSSEAMPYTVKNLIDGDDWLPATQVPYYSGLL